MKKQIIAFKPSRYKQIEKLPLNGIVFSVPDKIYT